MPDHTLYFAPHTCALSPHLALCEAELPFDLVRVDLKHQRLADGGDWLAINPKGYVPALRLPDGQILTEGAVMVQYIADLVPAKQLAPANGTLARVRLQEWLHFIATELHKGMSPLYDPLAGEDFKQQLRETRLPARWQTLAEAVADRPFLTGERFTVADGYAFYVMRSWIHAHKRTLARWPALGSYYQRLATRPAIAAALAAEGITA